MKRTKAFIGATVALAALGASVPAQAVNFVLTDTGGASKGTLARQGFEIATLYWSSVLKDNITVNLNIGFNQLGPNILGSTGSTRSLISMQQFYTAAAADRTSMLDNLAVASLPTLGVSTSVPGAGAVTAITNGFANGVDATNGYTDLTTRIDNDGSVNNSTLAITKATAKALGINIDVNGNAIPQGTVDGSITFSNQYNFDFNPTDGIAANAIDFISVAIHEIGHALGFVSGVDTYDARTSPGQTAAASLRSVEGNVVLSQLDLFRYSSTGNLDWSTQNTPYFSIDGGLTQLFGDSRFSTGVMNGDGRQASHWKDSPAGAPQLGILDPTAAYGQMGEVTALDLAAYDAIGYDIGFNVLTNPGYRFTTAQAYTAFVGQAAALPELATWLQMIAGVGIVGGAMRYRRRRTAVRFA